MMTIVIIYFSFILTAQARLPQAGAPNGPSNHNRDNFNQCQYRAAENQPNLSRQFDFVCNRLFLNSVPTERTAARTMADCLQLFRTFPSVTAASAAWACSHIVSSIDNHSENGTLLSNYDPDEMMTDSLEVNSSF